MNPLINPICGLASAVFFFIVWMVALFVDYQMYQKLIVKKDFLNKKRKKQKFIGKERIITEIDDLGNIRRYDADPKTK